MKHRLSRIAALCAVALLVAIGSPATGSPAPDPPQPAGVGAQTDSITLTAVADAGLYSAYPSTPHGSNPNMWTAWTSSFTSAALVRFDVAASIPAGAVIDSAVMRLYMHLVDPSFNDLTNVNIGAYYVTSPWNESTVTFNSAPTADPWGKPASVSTAVGWKSWDVTNWAQSWLDNPSSNNGALLYGPLSGSRYNRSYYTREAGSNRPSLAITYHVPLCVLQTQIPRAECEALEDLYNSTNGPGWTTHTGWLAALWPCTWHGVTCSGGHVQILSLDNNNLAGGMPSSLGSLTSLRDFRVSDNPLGGALPQSLKNLSLTHFYFANTNLCEPPDAAFQAWLAGIPNLSRTNVLCGSATPTPTPTVGPGTKKRLPIVMKQFAPAPPSAVIFADDFSSPLTGWSPNNGGWNIENNYLKGTYATGNAWFIKNASGSDFTYEGEVNILSGNAVGLTFRSSANGTASYDAILDVVDGAFKISKRPGYTVLAAYPWPVSRNRWYHVKVVVSGTKIEGYLDGVKRLTAYDANFASGQFGVMLFQATAAYDNLEARTLP